MQKSRKIQEIFLLLLNKFGPQHWWPGDTPFEVMVGAILTQQTSWKNVEKAIRNLKERGLLSPLEIYHLEERKLAEIIKPAGFYNIKASRLKAFVRFFAEEFASDAEKMKKSDLFVLREKLLSLKGIGRETADSILLYALDKPIFVVDAYTKRIVHRADISQSKDYEEIREMFEKSLSERNFLKELQRSGINSDLVYVFQEMHALIVAEGKFYCKKMPVCSECPLENICRKRGVLQ